MGVGFVAGMRRKVLQGGVSQPLRSPVIIHGGIAADEDDRSRRPTRQTEASCCKSLDSWGLFPVANRWTRETGKCQRPCRHSGTTWLPETRGLHLGLMLTDCSCQTRLAAVNRDDQEIRGSVLPQWFDLSGPDTLNMGR